MEYLCSWRDFSELDMEKLFICLLSFPTPLVLVIRKIFGRPCNYASSIEFWHMIKIILTVLQSGFVIKHAMNTSGPVMVKAIKHFLCL